MFAYTFTGNQLSVIVNGNSYTRSLDDPGVKKLMAALKSGTATDEEIIALASIKNAVDGYTGSDCTVRGNSVLRNGRELDKVLAERVIACMEANVPYTNLLAFFDRLSKNPSYRAVTELFRFLDHGNMPITPDGCFIGYKGVQDDYYSVHGNRATRVLQGTVDNGGRIFNGVGEIIGVERQDVTDDCTIACGPGLHVGSLRYATGWGSHTVLVKVDPADVVSVCKDENCEKLRCSKYIVMADLHDALPNTGLDENLNEYEQPIDLEDEDEDDNVYCW